MTVHNIKISHSVCCADSVSKQNETHPSTDIIIKDYMACEHITRSDNALNGSNVFTKSWFYEYQSHCYGIRPPLIKEIYAFTSLIGIPVKTTETTYNYKVSNQQNVNPAHAEYLEGAGKQDDNILYPRVDQLLTLMEWLQDLNEFHGWGLPKFKKFSSIDLTGAEFDPVGINFDDFVAHHKLNTNHSLGFVQLRDGNTINSETVTFNSPDYTQRTLSQYELFGENWHFTKMLYQIVDWLNQLAELHGITYWEDLLSINHLKVAKDRNQIGNTWRGWRQYTEDVAQESYEYGKFSFKDYQVLFPERMTKILPQQLSPLTYGVDRIFQPSTYVAPRNFISISLPYIAFDGRPPTGFQTDFSPHPSGSYLDIRFVAYKWLTLSSVILNPDVINIVGTSTWRPSIDYSGEDVIKGAIIETGISCHEVSINIQTSVNRYGQDVFIACELDEDQGDRYSNRNLTDIYLGVQVKWNDQAEAIYGNMTQFSSWYRGYNLQEHFGLSQPTYYSYNTGDMILSEENDFAVGGGPWYYYSGNFTISYPNETVFIGVIYLNKLTFLQRFGIKSENSNGTFVRVKQMYNMVEGELKNFWDSHGPQVKLQTKIYFGFTNDMTEFVPWPQNYALTDENQFIKIKDILESGTELLSINQEPYGYDELLEIDTSIVFGPNDKLCMFFGITRLWDHSLVDGYTTNSDMHEYVREFGDIDTALLNRYGIMYASREDVPERFLNTYPFRVEVDNDIYRPSEAVIP